MIVDSTTGETSKTAVAGEGSTIKVAGDADSFADAYLGKDSGLNFSEFDSSVGMTLQGSSVSSASFGDESVNVSGINAVQLGEGESTLLGSAEKETLAAGSGAATIWGGSGKDFMIGFTGNADDKNGAVTFGFMAGDGKDTISNFGFLNTENSLTADKILSTGEFADIKLNGNDVMLRFANNSSDMLTVKDAAGKNIQLVENNNLTNDNVTSVLQVAENALTYDGTATKYIATGSAASLNASSDANSVNVWLDSDYSALSDNTTYNGKIKTLNAAAVDGTATLVGNEYDNAITAAQGNSSLWGGKSSTNDTLVGGTGSDMFFYGVTGTSEGNDTISGINEDDTVNLFGVQLSDIDFNNTTITNSTITVKFNNGNGSLTMDNNGQTFMLANDTNQRYTYDKEESAWSIA